MTRAGEVERVAARRQRAIDYNRLLAAKVVIAIAAIPFGIAGVFVAAKRLLRGLRHFVRRLRRQAQGRSYGS